MILLKCLPTIDNRIFQNFDIVIFYHIHCLVNIRNFKHNDSFFCLCSCIRIKIFNFNAVFLENRKGRVGDFAKVLADNKIDLVSMSIADTKEFGILRAITRDNSKAVKVLREAGFTVTSSDLLLQQP